VPLCDIETKCKSAESTNHKIRNSENIHYPPQSYLDRLDALWLGLSSEPMASFRSGWTDGVIHLVTSNASNSDCENYSIYCACHSIAEFKFCTVAHASIICSRSSVLNQLCSRAIQSSIEKLISFCNHSCLNVNLNAVIHFDTELDQLIFSNIIVRYLYSSTLSIKSILELLLRYLNSDFLSDLSDRNLEADIFDYCMRKNSNSVILYMLINVMFKVP
jgi:hypothetical protein